MKKRLTLEQRREQLRKEFIGSDDQAEWLYQDAALCLRYGGEITEDHMQAIKYKHRKLVQQKAQQGAPF
jgi:hypothetical protein